MYRKTTPPEVRFWAKVQKTDGCWEWAGTKLPSGYGQLERADGGKRMYAHRFSYLIHYGDFDRSLYVLHRCDNPSCVKPDHLFLGTARDNLLDASSKGRHYNTKKTHCPYGHEYSVDNPWIHQGSRRCRECHNNRPRKSGTTTKEV
mgnify:CR=1 FL=1